MRGTLAVSSIYSGNWLTIYTTFCRPLWAVKKPVEIFLITTSGLELSIFESRKFGPLAEEIEAFPVGSFSLIDRGVRPLQGAVHFIIRFVQV